MSLTYCENIARICAFSCDDQRGQRHRQTPARGRDHFDDQPVVAEHKVRQHDVGGDRDQRHRARDPGAPLPDAAQLQQRHAQPHDDQREQRPPRRRPPEQLVVQDVVGEGRVGKPDEHDLVCERFVWRLAREHIRSLYVRKRLARTEIVERRDSARRHWEHLVADPDMTIACDIRRIGLQETHRHRQAERHVVAAGENEITLLDPAVSQVGAVAIPRFQYLFSDSGLRDWGAFDGELIKGDSYLPDDRERMLAHFAGTSVDSLWTLTIHDEPHDAGAFYSVALLGSCR